MALSTYFSIAIYNAWFRLCRSNDRGTTLLSYVSHKCVWVDVLFFLHAAITHTSWTWVYSSATWMSTFFLECLKVRLLHTIAVNNCIFAKRTSVYMEIQMYLWTWWKRWKCGTEAWWSCFKRILLQHLFIFFILREWLFGCGGGEYILNTEQPLSNMDSCSF